MAAAWRLGASRLNPAAMVAGSRKRRLFFMGLLVDF
jgi:hypothetical protein